MASRTEYPRQTDGRWYKGVDDQPTDELGQTASCQKQRGSNLQPSVPQGYHTSRRIPTATHIENFRGLSVLADRIVDLLPGSQYRNYNRPGPRRVDRVR